MRNEELLKVEGGSIQHNNNRIYNILKSGLSENHMHLKGSGYTTELSWEKIINSEIFQNKELQYFIENDNNFLDYKSKNKSTEKLLVFFTKMKVIKKLLLLNMDVNSEDIQNESLLYKTLTTKYFELLRLKDYNQMKIVSLGLTDCKLVWDSEMFDSLTEPYEKEYYRDLKYIKEKVMYGERKFLYNCFKLLLENNLSDTMQNLFNFYLIGLNFFKYELLQDNIGMGFQKFKEKENIKDLIIDNNNVIYISVFDKYYSEKCVEKIEFRIAPKSKDELKRLIDDLDNINDFLFEIHQRKNLCLKKINYGLIVHYIKNGSTYDLNSFSNFRDMRFSKIRKDIEYNYKLIDNFFEIYQNKYINLMGSKYLKVVGIDAANTEIANPPEVFAVSFRQHRYRLAPFMHLNFTFHVGEEFTSLSTGLRNIDETIIFFEYHRGDRLGHGLALGIDAKKHFSKKRNFITTNYQDYLDDIVWMYGILGERYKDNFTYRCFLESEYNKVTSNFKYKEDQYFEIEDYHDSLQLRSDSPNIYVDLFSASNIDIEYNALLRIYNNSFEPYLLNKNNKKHRKAFFNKKARELFRLYLYDKDYRKSGSKPIVFEVDDIFIEIVRKVQYILKEKISEKGIAIEANPSSNKKISSVSNYIELPFFNMNSHGLTKKNIENDKIVDIPISLNTDDSAIFQTDLRNEYSLICLALEKEGYDTEEIYEYIEYLRKSSMDQSFIN